MDCSLQGSSVHGIFQARVLEWVAISFSRGSSRPRDRTWDSRIADRHFYCLSHCSVVEGTPLLEVTKNALCSEQQEERLSESQETLVLGPP